MTSIENAQGRLLEYSDASKNHYSATNAGSTLTGSSANDSLWGDSSVRTNMSGGAGDDIYHLYSDLNTASESAKAGVDTIKTWMSYALPEHIENLTVTGAGRYAFGNSADNIIKGGPGEQTLDGSGGNDVLTGDSGSDIFILEAGGGSDRITDLGTEDTLRLDGYGLSSVAAVKAAMNQVGADVHLDLGKGEFALLSDRTVASFKESQFELSLDRSDLIPTFTENFDRLSLWNGTSGTWESNYWWGDPSGNSLEGNGEKQWYIDTDHAPTSSVDPFSVKDGVLSITAEETPSSIKPAVNGYDYTSGMLTSYESFSQTYGYFEIRADMPDDQGMWPAFWMLPKDASWPPELDVIEMTGQDPNTLIMTAHSNETGKQTSDRVVGHAADTSGFHTYGVLWGADEIVWYFDGMAVGSAATPADMHDPMYMLVNLAVGGVAGSPDAGFDGDEMKIDFIKAYTLSDADLGIV